MLALGNFNCIMHCLIWITFCSLAGCPYLFPNEVVVKPRPSIQASISERIYPPFLLFNDTNKVSRDKDKKNQYVLENSCRFGQFGPVPPLHAHSCSSVILPQA